MCYCNFFNFQALYYYLVTYLIIYINNKNVMTNLYLGSEQFQKILK